MNSAVRLGTFAFLIPLLLSAENGPRFRGSGGLRFLGVDGRLRLFGETMWWSLRRQMKTVLVALSALMPEEKRLFGTEKCFGKYRLPGNFQASMAVSNGKLFIRSDQELYCIHQ